MKPRTMIVVAVGVIVATGCGQTTSGAVSTAAPQTNPFGRKVVAQERWAFSDPKAVQDLQGTTFGEQEINEFWTRKGWKLTKREEAYLATIDALARDGFITKVSRWAKCPASHTPTTDRRRRRHPRCRRSRARGSGRRRRPPIAGVR